MATLKIKQLRRIGTLVDEEIEIKLRSLKSCNSNKFKDLDAAIESGMHQVNTNSTVIDMLLDVKYQIRKFIADFNNNTKINDNCAKIAKLSEKLNLMTVQKGLSVARYIPASSYGDSNPHHLSGVTSEFKEGVRLEMRSIQREIQALKDSCSGINAAGEVEVDQDFLETCYMFNFIDEI